MALFSMYVRKEALMSSQIEGTQATLEDIFDPLIDNNTNRDVADVVNYVTYPPPTIIIVEVGASCSRQASLPDLTSYPRGPRGSLYDASCTKLTHSFLLYVYRCIPVSVMICQAPVTEPFFHT